MVNCPIEVITAPALRLDLPTDRQRLTDTVQRLRPVLLILDPLIRLHRLDENDASQIAALLSFLRELQREYKLAVLVVHHARKDSNASRPGQSLRGWSDSNLYMRRKCERLTLTTEHRAAPSQEHLFLALTQTGAALAELSDQGLVSHDNRGYQLKLPFEDPRVSLPLPIDPRGNGNGKRPTLNARPA